METLCTRCRMCRGWEEVQAIRNLGPPRPRGPSASLEVVMGLWVSVMDPNSPFGALGCLYGKLRKVLG